jgi:ABC-type dipeptide/oligopeptide/nickel transport system permease subunit
VSERLRVPRFARSRDGVAGLLILGLVLAIALLGPVFAPHDPYATVGVPASPPSSDALLGTDVLGRDILSRVLHGGLSVLWLGALTTMLVMLAGVTIGMAAGYVGSWVDAGLMRVLDVILSVPALLLVLLLVTGLGTTIAVLVLGAVAVQIPSVARLVRAATQEVSTRAYVEAAVARGERAIAIMLRDVLPNIASIVLADFGIRFGYSVIIIASMNFLGLGLDPPAADWGLMISENRQVLATNPLAVVAPAALLALLTLAVNLVADAYGLSRGTSDVLAEDLASTSPSSSVGDPLAPAS